MNNFFLNGFGAVILAVIYVSVAWGICKLIGLSVERAMLVTIFIVLAEIRWNQVDKSW